MPHLLLALGAVKAVAEFLCTPVGQDIARAWFSDTQKLKDDLDKVWKAIEARLK